MWSAFLFFLIIRRLDARKAIAQVEFLLVCDRYDEGGEECFVLFFGLLEDQAIVLSSASFDELFKREGVDIELFLELHDVGLRCGRLGERFLDRSWLGRCRARCVFRVLIIVDALVNVAFLLLRRLDETALHR